jgi:hypothetical protein
LILCVVDAAGARGNSPACGGLKQVRALFSVHRADARRRTKGYQKPEAKRRFKPASRMVSLLLRALIPDKMAVKIKIDYFVEIGVKIGDE